MYKFLFLLFFTIGFSACGDDSGNSDANTYEAEKTSLSSREKRNPLAFLRLKSEHKKNWLGLTVVNGTISNTAAVSNFTNVRVKMLCFDAKNRLVEEHEDVLDAILEPNTTRDFKLRYRLPRTTDSINVSIMSAAVHEP